MSNLELNRTSIVAAGIVLYNPDDFDRFNRCINSILTQVEKVYIFINGDSNVELIESDKIVYINENKNKGVAYALNSIMNMAKNDGFKWVLTMDQDSILPNGMIKDFTRHFDNNEIGIICPQVVDKRRSYMTYKQNSDEDFVDFCITSASCTSIEIWEKVGRFDEWLFIDLVDNDFCKRLTLGGFKILQINKWVLDQEFGKIIPKSKTKQEFWIKLSKITGIVNIAKLSYYKYVNPLRVYYTCRNIIYLNKKMKKYGKVGYENYNCKSYLGFIISFILPSFFRAQEKTKVLRAICQGTIDGIKSNKKG